MERICVTFCLIVLGLVQVVGNQHLTLLPIENVNDVSINNSNGAKTSPRILKEQNLVELTIQSTEGGKIMYNQEVLSVPETLNLEQGSFVTFSIFANSGYYLEDVLYNESSVISEMEDGELALTGINENSTLKVVFKSATDLVIANPNGNLKKKIEDLGANVKLVSSLSLTGEVTEADFDVMKNEMTSLQHIDLSGSTLTTIPNEALKGKGMLLSFKLPTTVTSIGKNAFQECVSLSTFTGFENVEIIGDYAFGNCKALTVLPFLANKIKRIEDFAFENFGKIVMEELIFSSSFQHIGIANFGFSAIDIKHIDMSSCTYTDEINYYPFPKSLTSIKLPEYGKYAIGYLSLFDTKITELVLPKCVSQIKGHTVFPSTLKHLYIRNEQLKADERSFESVDKESAIIYVPIGSGLDYKYASYWGEFKNIVEYGFSVKTNDYGHIKINGEDANNGDIYFPQAGVDTKITFIPDTKYHTGTVIFNDEVVELSQDGTFTIPADVMLGALDVKFSPDKFDITISCTGNGKVKYNGYEYINGSNISADYNSVVTLSLEPAEGNMVKSVTFNGLESVVQNGGTTYVTPIIIDNSTFAVEFAESSDVTNVVEFKVSVGSNGSIGYKNTTLLPTTSILVKTTENAEFIIKPALKYTLEKVLLNGVDVTANVTENRFTIQKEDIVESKLDVTFRLDDVISVNVEEAGTLNKLLSAEQKLIVSKLTLTGFMNDDDFTTLRTELPSLSILDLSGVKNSIIPTRAFNISWEWSNDVGMTTLKQVLLPIHLTEICEGAFAGCKNLEYVNFEDLASLSIIGNRAFASTGLKNIDLSNSKISDLTSNQFRFVYSLESMNFPLGLARIGEQFENSRLTSVDLSACTKLESIDKTFKTCSQLENVILPIGLKTIVGAFYSCRSLKNVDLSGLTNLTSIGNETFINCVALESITIPESVKNIGWQAFGGSYVSVNMTSAIPPTLDAEDIFSDATLIYVPDESLMTYRTALNWIKYANQIISKDAQTIWDVTTTAEEMTSSLRHAIVGTYESADADAMLTNVTSLKITGTINSYDIMIMRNKMIALRDLDLSEASIVANDYEYYQGCHTEDDILGAYSFYDLKLRTVNLPKSIKEIGSHAFARNSALKTVIFHEGLKTIGDEAFYDCSSIESLDIPITVSNIQNAAFVNNLNLRYLNIPNESELREINGRVFQSAISLEELNLPYRITKIGSQAFDNCRALKEIHIPTMVRTIENNAFTGCSNVEKVYAATIEPITINQNTFSCWTTAILYIPDFNTSYYKYYWDTQWSQFVYAKERYHQDYESFYINGDYTIEENDERIEGPGNVKPNGEFNEGSGFIVDGDKKQELGEVTVSSDGENGGSIIAEGGSEGSDEGNVTMDKLNIKIAVQPNKWYFFCFPFDIAKEAITCDANYVFRHYDGKSRAEHGNSGWKNVTESEGEYLKAGKGYIFQCDKSTDLVLTIDNPAFNGKDKKSPELDENTSDNTQDANWNFVGNPFLSYFNLDDLQYNAPVTVWNGSTYEALRPGDDDYSFHPFQAFFIQKPEGVDDFDFYASGRETKKQSEKNQAKAKAMRAKKAPAADRKLINLIITDGENVDKTRVVFNAKKADAYEMDCDAAKFMSTTDVPQIYTLDNKNVKYAINERPSGSVKLGYVATKAGTLTIAVARMEQTVSIKDNETGTITPLTDGYSFETEAGTFNERFVLLLGDPTGIKELASPESSLEGQDLYNTNGVKVGSNYEGVVIAKDKKYIKK